MKNQSIIPEHVVPFGIMVITVISAILFYGSDYVDYLNSNHYTDGWRYLPLLAVIDLLFAVAAVIYLLLRKWWLAFYAALLGVSMNLCAGFWPIHLAGLIIAVLALVILLLFWRKFMVL